MADINTVFRITAAVAGSDAVKQLGERINQVSTNGENMRRSFVQGAAFVAKFATAAVAAAGATFGFIKPLIDLGDNLNDISQRTGVAVEALAKYAVAAQNSGTSIEQLAGGFTRLNRNLVEAKDGTGATAEALRAMGISLKDASGQLKNADQITREVSDLFAQFPDGPQKAALAMALFGKSGAELIPLLNMGSAAINEFGLNIDQDFASKADAFNDRLGIMGAQVKNFGIAIAKELLPAINSALDFINYMMKGFALGFVTIFQVVKASILEMANFINSTINTLVIKPINATLAAINGIAGSSISTIPEFSTRSIGAASSDAGNAISAAAQNLFGPKAPATAAETPKITEQQIAGMNSFTGTDEAGRAADRAAAALQRATEASNEWLAKQRESIETLKMESEFIGRTTNEIEQMKDARQIMTEAQEKAANLSGEAKERFLREAEAIAAMRKEVMQYNYEQQRTFGAGARSFLVKYAEDASNAAEQVKTALTNAFRGAEDALVEFVTTGKLNFRSFAQSIISDLARIAIQRSITGPLASLLGGMFGGGGGGTALAGAGWTPFGFATGGVMTASGPMPLRTYAAGGIANSPQMALFGEGSMAEAYVPLPDGRRIPVALKGGGGANVNVTVNMTTGQTDSRANSTEAGKLGNLIAASVKSILINEKRPGGLLAAT